MKKKSRTVFCSEPRLRVGLRDSSREEFSQAVREHLEPSSAFDGYDIHLEWDAQAGVWTILDSQVPGLVGEAATLDAMMMLLRHRVPEMLAENACPVEDDIRVRLLTTAHLSGLPKVA